LRISALACQFEKPVVVSVVREQDKRPLNRRADRPFEDDKGQKIADASFWAANADGKIDDEVDDAGVTSCDMSCVMSSKVAVAISREVSRSTSRRCWDRSS
jgi:hypothetical protein